jgi:hypothetical protein
MDSRSNADYFVTTVDEQGALLYVHFDADAGRYWLSDKPLGACVFTRTNAHAFIKHLTMGSTTMWHVVRVASGKDDSVQYLTLDDAMQEPKRLKVLQEDGVVNDRAD